MISYYLAIGSEPPRFAYYLYVRALGWQTLGHKPWDHVYDHRITQDELDYYLKKKLRVPPEQRYQQKKQNWFFHELSYLHQTVDENGKPVDVVKESGCGHWSNNGEEGVCVRGCKYYHKYGRIEDDEVLHEHKEIIERHLQRNDIVSIDISADRHNGSDYQEFMKTWITL